MDRHGNEWVKGPYHGDPSLDFSFEWDVRLRDPKGPWSNGKPYINVRPDGHLSH